MNFRKYPFDHHKCQFLIYPLHDEKTKLILKKANYSKTLQSPQTFWTEITSIKQTVTQIGGVFYSTVGFEVVLQRYQLKAFSN
jgi:ABC-type multidrug transport system permease subunit